MTVIKTILVILLSSIIFNGYSNDNPIHERTDTANFIYIDYNDILSDTTSYEDTIIFTKLNSIIYVIRFDGATPFFYMFNDKYIIYIEPPYPLLTFDKITTLINTGSIVTYKRDKVRSIDISIQKVKEVQNLVCCNKCFKMKFKEFVFIKYQNGKAIINSDLFNDILKLINRHKVRRKTKKCLSS